MISYIMITPGEGNTLVELKYYEQPGLYLLFRDATRLALTRANIERITARYWSDPARIPPHIKQVVDFKRCGLCPLQGQHDLCDALRPVLPFLDVFDHFSSHDEVVAVYRSASQPMLFVAETTMHGALRDISLLSLMRYCQVGQKYWKYYYGIVPLMSDEEILDRVYLNMYWLNGGDQRKVDQEIGRYTREITMTAQNQIRRLALIAKNDAFLNALVHVQMTGELLSANHARALQQSFDKFMESM
jgi:hypothetical protein